MKEAEETPQQSARKCKRAPDQKVETYRGVKRARSYADIASHTADGDHPASPYAKTDAAHDLQTAVRSLTTRKDFITSASSIRTLHAAYFKSPKLRRDQCNVSEKRFKKKEERLPHVPDVESTYFG